MTRPTDPARYPLAFEQALERLYAMPDGRLVIPSENPAALRSQFYGYFNALRRHGRREMADAVYVTLDPAKPAKGQAGKVILNLRDSSPFAREISAALSTPLGDTPNEPF